MPAVISSSFDIIVIESLQNSAVTVTNPGRTFRLVEVLATGTAGAGITVKKNDNAGTTAAGSTQINAAVPSSSPIAVSGTLANVLFTATDNIYIVEDQNQLCTRVVLRCVAYDAQELTTA